MKTYAANELNQYTAIANPDAVALRGSATNTATVTVNGNGVSRDCIASDTVPWHFALEADNGNGPDYTFAEIVGVINPPGTNTPDIVSVESGHVYAPPQNETLTYDDDGNLLGDGRWQYTWNGENRLIKAEEQICPTNRTLRKVDYAYDHQGRMVWKEIKHRDAEAQSWEEEKGTSYLWDNFNIIAETTVADSATNTTYNIWGLDIDGTLQGAGGVGGLLAVIQDSGIYIPAWDANGNIMEYFSTDGTIAAHREYDPFGGTVVATGEANAFTHWFSTKPWCAATSLSEYQFRKYRPSVGRWLNRDPIGENGGMNLIGFCCNNSLSLIDPAGRAPQYIYDGVTIDYDPETGRTTIQTSPDWDWGDFDSHAGQPRRIHPDPSFYINGGGAISLSFVMATHEFHFSDGCVFYCLSITPTELLGVSAGASIGKDSIPVEVTYGIGRHIGVTTGVTTFGGSVGAGISLSPVSVSVRMICFSLTNKDRNGCPCKELKPASVAGNAVK